MHQTSICSTAFSTATAVHIFLLCLFAPFSLAAESDIQWSADFRLRLEQDWDSTNRSGAQRDDRLRARIRARASVHVAPSDSWDFGVRLRTGSDASQQSGHITIYDFDDNPRGNEHVNADLWFARYQSAGHSVWVGRNRYPFWKQNAMFWDDDATLIGFAYKGGELVEFNVGLFTLPVGLTKNHGQMLAGQVKYANGAGLSLAGGLFELRGDPDDQKAAALLLDDNGQRDYRLLQFHGQWIKTTPGGVLKLGLDYSHNLLNYNDPLDSFASERRDQTDGFVLSCQFSPDKLQGVFNFGYFYADIETLAVHNSYSQDDWMRWGGGGQTRSSGFTGHELGVTWRHSKRMNIVARVFSAESLDSVEDGKRARVEVNFRF